MIEQTVKAVILTASNMKKDIGGEVLRGKCITAFDLDHSRIIRLVGRSDGRPMPSPPCDKYYPLEVYKIGLAQSCPLHCQTENILRNICFLQKSSVADN